MAIAGVAVLFYFIGLHANSCQTNAETGGLSGDVNVTPGNDGLNGRLPRHIEPILYKIELFPNMYGKDPSTFNFNGTTWLKFRCLVKSYNLTLNVNKLNIQRISIDEITDTDGPGVRYATNFTIDEFWQMLIIYVSVPFEKDKEYYVEIDFDGPLREDYAGLYLSKFQNKADNPYVAATQFSPTDARKAFPCFDEPDRKAQFEITLVRKKDFVSLSCMPKTREEPRSDDFVADVFDRTPTMSTYLLAVVVGDFTSLTVAAREGLNYTSWAGENDIDKTKRSLDFGASVLSHFEDYFQNPFPLPKQDMLAVPETAVGAMENWGLIIFQQVRIFYQEDVYSKESLLQSSLTIAHELAHQWFGNLVTLNWWSQLMLKEGFAVYFEEVGVDKVHPDWNVMDQFAVRKMHRVFETDSLESSHPLEMDLKDTTEIRQVFDSISYSKGGCMIRMLNFILGPDDFQAGLRKYLETYKYRNVGFNELWTAVQPENWSEPSVPDVMNTWILQENYPLVTISQIKPGILHISQERYLSAPKPEIDQTFVWAIPLTFTSSIENNFTVDHTHIIWVDNSDMVIIDREIPDLKIDRNWIIANIQQQGYYRVNYDKFVWRNIIQQLKSNVSLIHPVNRAQVINDLFSLSKSKRVTMDLALEVLEYLQQEHNYVPWVAALRENNFMFNLLKHTPMFARYKQTWGYLIDNPLLRLEQKRANNKLSMSEELLYDDLYSLGLRYEIQRCVEKAKAEFGKLQQNPNQPLDPGTRQASLCTVLREANSESWLFVLTLYNATTDVEVKTSYLLALTCTNNSVLQEMLLKLTEDGNTIKGSDIIQTLVQLAKNPSAVDKVWQYLTTKWDYFLDKFGGGLFQLAGVVTGIIGEFTTKKQLLDVETFVNSTTTLGSAKQAFDQGMETIKSNIKWVSENSKPLETWVDKILQTYT